MVVTWLLAQPSADEEIEESAQSLWDTTVDAVPRVAVAIAIVIIGWLLSRGLRWLLRRYFSRRQTPSFALVMSKLGGWLLLSVIVLLAIAITFPSVKPVDLLAGLGFFSVAVGFAFQDILENTLAGVLLLFRQPFRAGDQIEVLDRTGTVDGITIRETRLTTFDGELVIIPNRDVYKNVILVTTSGPRLRQHFTVGIAYENDPVEATSVIADALATTEGIDLDPGPFALVRQLGVSTVDIDAFFWSDPRRRDAIGALDRAITNVKKALDEHGIEMPAEIIALQATPSFRAALQDSGEITPAGNLRQSAGS